MAELSVLLKMKDEMSRQLDAAKGKLGGFSGALKGMGIGIAAGGAALVGLGAAAIKSGADFEAGMREVNTMIGLNEEQFQNLSQQVLDLSAEVGKGGDELADALYQAVSAGVPASEAINMIRTSAQAAVGGVTDVTTATDGLTTVLNAFKIPASEAGSVADVMFTTVKGGKTTFEELSASMFNVAPIAAAAGVSFEEIAGAIATVTKQGVPTSVATTQLRAAIQAIIKPTADMKAALDDLGYATGDAMLQELGFQGALDTLSTATNGSTETLGKMFGSVEAMSAVLSLTGENAATFSADLENSMNAAGAATDAYNEINKGTSRQFEILQEKVQALLAELGTQLLPLLTPLIDGFMKLIDSLPIDEIGELLSNLLPPLVDALMSLLDALPIDGFIKLVESALKPTFAILGKVMGAIPTDAFNALLDALTPIIDVLGEIILLIPIEPFLDLVGILVKDLAPILRLVATILDTILKPVLQLVFFLLEKIMDVLGPVLEGVGKVIGWVAGGLGKAANAVGGFFGNLFGGATGAIVTSPTLAMIGEAGPEAVVPLSSAPGASALSGFGGGQTTINITVQGSVLSENDLVETVRSGLIRTGRANVSALGAFA